MLYDVVFVLRKIRFYMQNFEGRGTNKRACRFFAVVNLISDLIVGLQKGIKKEEKSIIYFEKF